MNKVNNIIRIPAFLRQLTRATSYLTYESPPWF